MFFAKRSRLFKNLRFWNVIKWQSISWITVLDTTQWTMAGGKKRSAWPMRLSIHWYISPSCHWHSAGTPQNRHFVDSAEASKLLKSQARVWFTLTLHRLTDFGACLYFSSTETCINRSWRRAGWPILLRGPTHTNARTLARTHARKHTHTHARSFYLKDHRHTSIKTRVLSGSDEVTY